MDARRGKGLDRRQFLIQGATAATAATLAGERMLEAAAQGPTVVVVRDGSRSVTRRGNVNAALVQRMVDEAVKRLAQKEDVSRAWGSFVGPKDRVAIKFNGLFNRATTHKEVIAAVVKGLVKAGVNPDNVVVFDRDERAFRTTKLVLNQSKPGPIFRPNTEYGPSVNAGPVKTKLSKIVLDADVLVNLPIMKTHSIAGVSGALKNHLGTIPKRDARAFHRNGCAHVADLNALSPIKAKTRICIADALYGLYNGGPQFRPQFRWDYYGVIASADPVALDAVLADILKAKRVEKGMSPHARPLNHIMRAAELGLGTADLAKINRVQIQV